MIYRLVFIFFIIMCFIELLCIRKLYMTDKRESSNLKAVQKIATKNDRLLRMALKWVEKNKYSNCVYEYLKERKYSSVIIYGMHYVGELLVEELRETDIEIVCGIDKNSDDIISYIKLIHPDEEIPDADIIIVTAVTYFSEIEESLFERVKCPIVSLEDIIYY